MSGSRRDETWVQKCFPYGWFSLLFVAGWVVDVSFSIVFWIISNKLFRCVMFYMLNVTGVSLHLLSALSLFVPFVLVFPLQFPLRLCFVDFPPFFGFGLRVAIVGLFLGTLYPSIDSQLVLCAFCLVATVIDFEFRLFSTPSRRLSAKEPLNRSSFLSTRWVSVQSFGVLSVAAMRYLNWSHDPIWEAKTFYWAVVLGCVLLFGLFVSFAEEFVLWRCYDSEQGIFRCLVPKKGSVCVGILKNRDAVEKEDESGSKQCCWSCLSLLQSFLSGLLWSLGFSSIWFFVMKFACAPHTLGNSVSLSYDFAAAVIATLSVACALSHIRFVWSPLVLYCIQLPSLLLTEFLSSPLASFAVGCIFTASLIPLMLIYLEEGRGMRGGLLGWLSLALIWLMFHVFGHSGAYQYTFLPGFGHLYGGASYNNGVWYLVLVPISMGSFILNRIDLMRRIFARVGIASVFLLLASPFSFDDAIAETDMEFEKRSVLVLGAEQPGARKSVLMPGDDDQDKLPIVESCAEESNINVELKGNVVEVEEEVEEEEEEEEEEEGEYVGEEVEEDGGGDSSSSSSSSSSNDEENEMEEEEIMIPGETSRADRNPNKKMTARFGLVAVATSVIATLLWLLGCFIFLGITSDPVVEPFSTNYLRIATSNVYHGFTLAGQSNYDMILEFLNTKQIDVVGFQEAGFNRADVGYHSFQDIVRYQGKYHLAKSNMGRVTTLDVAIASKFGIAESSTGVLPFDPEGLLRPYAWAMVTFNRTEIAVFNLHLDYYPNGTALKQVKVILDLIDEEGISGPIVILGDLNVNTTDPAIGFLLDRGFRDVSVVANGERPSFTYGFEGHSSKGGLESIDYIFVSHHFQVLQSEVFLRAGADTDPAKRMSDHLPVWCDLVLK